MAKFYSNLINILLLLLLLLHFLIKQKKKKKEKKEKHKKYILTDAGAFTMRTNWLLVEIGAEPHIPGNAALVCMT